eukprot:TRINITY_DN61040_c0_g1_i1.p2 TRINITY_DN61040_c0_g1~~TRINITY_DN61040_c0_g1_i1.p2  ORF type:complete len:149 (-),score=17.51 TRINITY_DN61040_c0_g1_i1:514-960(-)
MSSAEETRDDASVACVQCTGCEGVLAFPSGAREVVCPICRASNVPDERVIRCPRCETDLAFPTAAKAIVCGVCDMKLKTERWSQGRTRERPQRRRQHALSDPVYVVHHPSRPGSDGKLCPVISLAKVVREVRAPVMQDVALEGEAELL